MALSNGMSHFSGNKSAYDKSSDTVSEETQIISVQVPVGEDECIGKNYSDIEEIFEIKVLRIFLLSKRKI